MNHNDSYSVREFPASRVSTFDVCEVGRKKHNMQALVEIDVTKARKIIRAHKKNGVRVSFTAWVLKCIGSVCAEHKRLHGVKKGKRRVAVFNEVDISILVERDVQGQRVPLPYVIRNVDNKTIAEITNEIRQAQKQPIDDNGDFVLGDYNNKSLLKIYHYLPGPVRRFLIKRLVKSPKLTNKHMGTVVVTSLGMMGRFKGWFIPVSIHPLTIAIGSVVKKPDVFENQITIRDHLYLTVLVNHDVIDGAPAARALSDLISLLENGYSL